MWKIKRWIVAWLGLEVELARIWQTLHYVSSKAAAANTNMDYFLRAADAYDQLSPERKAASDKIGAEVIGRLIAEDKARRHTEGKDL